jgi:Uma2 family endonuclease
MNKKSQPAKIRRIFRESKFFSSKMYLVQKIRSLIETLELRELTDYELESGKPMPRKKHGYLQSRITSLLDYNYRQHLTIFSELEIVMPEKPDAVPDIAIYPKMAIDFLGDDLPMTQMPLTAIEIASPLQSDGELVEKINRYLHAGVKSCWLVLPILKAVYIYSAIGEYQFFNTDMTLSDLVTNIELSLPEIFS